MAYERLICETIVKRDNADATVTLNENGGLTVHTDLELRQSTLSMLKMFESAGKPVDIELTEAALTFGELSKVRGTINRWAILADRLAKNDTFTIEKSKTAVKLTAEQSVIDTIRSGHMTKLEHKNAELSGSDGKSYKISNIRKDGHFGAGAGKAAGLTEEKTSVGRLNQLIAEYGVDGILSLKIGGTVYKVKKAEITKKPSTSKTAPKSDFNFVDGAGRPNVWISYKKDGKSAKDFNQFGGISEKVPFVFNHPETVSFLADAIEKYPDGLPPATTIGRHIKDKTLGLVAVYGRDYGHALGPENVTIIIHSAPENLTAHEVSPGVFELTTKKGSIHLNGQQLTGEYSPMYMARYTNRNSSGLKNARAGIFPQGSRKVNALI